MFDRLPADLSVTLKPVLFAGLLDHWGQKGPAEIPGKRVHTYRYCGWFAERHRIAFRAPPAHPFNPLGPLRLAVALGAEPEAVGEIFAAIWSDGTDVVSEAGWARLAARVGLDAETAKKQVERQCIKDRLRANTEEAVEHGVFGVPSIVCNHEVFWGVDATDMFLDYLADPAMFRGGEMARIATLPVGQARKI